jgi:hypothetical protein
VMHAKYLGRCFLPSPLMGEVEGGGEARARPACRAMPSPHPNRSPPLCGRRGASLTAPLPPPGGKEKKACTRTYVQGLRAAFRLAGLSGDCGRRGSAYERRGRDEGEIAQ